MAFIQSILIASTAKLVPRHGSISLQDLQRKTILDSVNLARVLRMAMTNGIFREPSPGVIAHTACSRALAEDDDLQAWVGFNTEDIFPASAGVLEALKTYPEANNPLRSGFNVAFDTVDKEPMFTTFGRDPERAQRFARAMKSLTGGVGYEVEHLLDVERGGYDFSAINDVKGTFVDVGGSHGFVCRELARRYRNMQFVVQDTPQTIKSASTPIDDDEQVASRINLQGHDFFTEQPVKGADGKQYVSQPSETLSRHITLTTIFSSVYLFRWIMHNYSTPFAVKILRALIPALKPGARVLINDHCVREPGQENAWDEQIIRGMDMVMLVLLNAQERTEEEYRQLFAQADEGFVYRVSYIILPRMTRTAPGRVWRLTSMCCRALQGRRTAVWLSLRLCGNLTRLNEFIGDGLTWKQQRAFGWSEFNMHPRDACFPIVYRLGGCLCSLIFPIPFLSIVWRRRLVHNVTSGSCCRTRCPFTIGRWTVVCTSYLSCRDFISSDKCYHAPRMRCCKAVRRFAENTLFPPQSIVVMCPGDSQCHPVQGPLHVQRQRSHSSSLGHFVSTWETSTQMSNYRHSPHLRTR